MPKICRSFLPRMVILPEPGQKARRGELVNLDGILYNEKQRNQRLRERKKKP